MVEVVVLTFFSFVCLFCILLLLMDIPTDIDTGSLVLEANCNSILLVRFELEQ